MAPQIVEINSQTDEYGTRFFHTGKVSFLYKARNYRVINGQMNADQKLNQGRKHKS